MQGYAALWVPGTDHAGIATQIKVEEELRVKEGKTRYDLGREKFLERVWKWKEEYGNRIVQQQKKMGVSCDWSRARFTMDEGCSKAVRETFCELYDKGLIYKGSRIINWCPHCVTALSDAEVEYVDKPGHLWYIRYPLADGSGDIVVATTRPETMMGDTGVAVNPNDEKFKHLIGKTCILPIMNREIPIVGDEYCEIGFGTGAVKMTPAHDPNDFEVGLRHNLEVIRVIADDGKINENGGPYNGMDRYECRKAIVKDLEEQGYLVKVEPYNHNVGTCYRCHNDVEPLISAQWFVKMEPLAKEALRVVNEGEVKFVPERFSKTYTNWMENCHDWCISRQRLWGVPILALLCEDCGEAWNDPEWMRDIAARFAKHPTGCDYWYEADMKDIVPEGLKCPKCGGQRWKRESDILDVWFDSGTSFAAVLEKRPELGFPADLYLEGSDQHRGWFHSSLLASIGTRGVPPYKAVLTHGYVVDGEGRKMSKSIGNGIELDEIISKHGAEIIRMWVSSVDYREDVRISAEIVNRLVDAYRRIRNTCRYLLGNLKDVAKADLVDVKDMDPLDRYALDVAARTHQRVQDAYRDYEFHKVFHSLHNLCSTDLSAFYLDILKDRLYSSAPASRARRSAQTALYHILLMLVQDMAPVLSFTAEEVFRHIPEALHPGAKSVFAFQLMDADAFLLDDADRKRWEAVLAARTEVTRAIEPLRKAGTVGHALDTAVTLYASPELLEVLGGIGTDLRAVCIVSQLHLAPLADAPADLAQADIAECGKLAVSVAKAVGEKCERCWIYSDELGSDPEHPTLCPRCAAVMKELA